MTIRTLDPAQKQALLERFLRYVAVDTQSDDNAACFPSTEKQKDLSRILVADLQALGCEDAAMDPWGYVMATVPGNLPAGHPAAGKVPVLGFLAHLDTYHATPGYGVKPQVIQDYRGGAIPLPGDPGHALWKRDFKGACGLFSFELRPVPKPALAAFLDKSIDPKP